MAATSKLVNAVLGDRFSDIDKQELNMAEIIEQEVHIALWNYNFCYDSMKTIFF